MSALRRRGGGGRFRDGGLSRCCTSSWRSADWPARRGTSLALPGLLRPPGETLWLLQRTDRSHDRPRMNGACTTRSRRDSPRSSSDSTRRTRNRQARPAACRCAWRRRPRRPPPRPGRRSANRRNKRPVPPTPHATADVDPQRPCSGALTKGRPLFVRRRFVVRRPFAVNVF